MNYAPVLIATVNRYEHFKACIESLSRCVWADKTDVFVAVDYPVSEKYREGYIQIKNYLTRCGNLGFKSLNLVYRETNYYFSGKGNMKTLMDDVFKSYDRIIVSEDDNVFSKNFLIYIDKGLEKYVNDPSVFSINGYCPPYVFSFKNSNFFRQNVDFSAWGYGMWKDRYEEYCLKIDKEYFKKNFLKGLVRIWSNGAYRLYQFISTSFGKSNISITDNILSLYIKLEGMTVIMPKINKVVNNGWDDSGLHCQDDSLKSFLVNSELDPNTDFEFQGDGWDYFKVNCKECIRNNSRIMNFPYMMKSLFLDFLSKIR